MFVKSLWGTSKWRKTFYYDYHWTRVFIENLPSQSQDAVFSFRNLQNDSNQLSGYELINAVKKIIYRIILYLNDMALIKQNKWKEIAAWNILASLVGSRNCSIVLIPESTNDLAFAGPIPATRVKRFIAVFVSSDLI